MQAGSSAKSRRVAAPWQQRRGSGAAAAPQRRRRAAAARRRGQQRGSSGAAAVWRVRACVCSGSVARARVCMCACACVCAVRVPLSLPLPLPLSLPLPLRTLEAYTPVRVGRCCPPSGGVRGGGGGESRSVQGRSPGTLEALRGALGHVDLLSITGAQAAAGHLEGFHIEGTPGAGAVAQPRSRWAKGSPGGGSVVSGKGKCVVRLWEGVASPGEARARVCVCGKQQAASSKQQASDERDGDVASPVGRTPLRATLRLSDGLCAVRTW